MRRAARIDDNQREIVEALESVGCSVQSLAAVGNGVPDLLVFSPHRFDLASGLMLIEVKDGKKAASRRKLTKNQVKWHQTWKGPVHIVKDVNEAYSAIGLKAV